MKRDTFTQRNEILQEDSFSAARWTALLAGGAITLLGLTRKSATRIALLGTGATIAALSFRNTSEQAATKDYAEASIIVGIPQGRAYSYWRDFGNLPNFMHHLKSVQVIDPRH